MAAGAAPVSGDAPAPGRHRLEDDAAPLVEPTFLDMKAGFADARAEADAVAQIVEEFPRQMTRIASEAGRKAGERAGRKFGLIALVVALVVALLVSVAALSVAVRAAGDSAAARVAATSAQQQVDTAMDRLGEANEVLQARGQAPIPAPADVDPTTALSAAILAQVLADLPPVPTADQVAGRIQAAVTANVLGPSMDELRDLAAAYYAANPPPGPTAEQIQDAVDRAYAANPPDDGEDGQPGDRGPAGPAGRSVLSGPTPVRLGDGSCVLRVTYDQAPEVVDYPAGDAVCPPADPPPPTTTPPATTVTPTQEPSGEPQGLARILGG